MEISSGLTIRDSTCRLKGGGRWPSACGLPMLQDTTSSKGSEDGSASSCAFSAVATSSTLPRTEYCISTRCAFSVLAERRGCGVKDDMDRHHKIAGKNNTV